MNANRKPWIMRIPPEIFWPVCGGSLIVLIYLFLSRVCGC
jgi:hypothetical protein